MPKSDGVLRHVRTVQVHTCVIMYAGAVCTETRGKRNQKESPQPRAPQKYGILVCMYIIVCVQYITILD